MNSLRTTVFTALVGCLVTGASAQSSFTMTWGQSYVQTGVASSSTHRYYVDFKIDGVNPSQYNYGNIGYQSWQGDGVYPASVDLDSQFHHRSGDFVFLGDLTTNYIGGFWFNLGNDGNVEIAAALYDDPDIYFGMGDHLFPNAPLLSQYDDLQNLSAGQAFNVNVPGFTPGSGTNANHTFYSLVDLTAGLTPLSGISADESAFNLNIPAGVLIGGHDYSLKMLYSRGTSADNTDLNGATSYLRYSSLVTTNFSVPAAVPEPATMAGLGLGALALLRRRKK
jgi:hypothetical protein